MTRRVYVCDERVVCEAGKHTKEAVKITLQCYVVCVSEREK